MVQSANENKSLIMLVELNLCAEKWDEEKWSYKKLAAEVKGSLAQCGLYLVYLIDRIVKILNLYLIGINQRLI